MESDLAACICDCVRVQSLPAASCRCTMRSVRSWQCRSCITVTDQTVESLPRCCDLGAVMYTNFDLQVGSIESGHARRHPESCIWPAGTDTASAHLQTGFAFLLQASASSRIRRLQLHLRTRRASVARQPLARQSRKQLPSPAPVVMRRRTPGSARHLRRLQLQGMTVSPPAGGNAQRWTPGSCCVACSVVFRWRSAATLHTFCLSAASVWWSNVAHTLGAKT